MNSSVTFLSVVVSLGNVSVANGMFLNPIIDTTGGVQQQVVDGDMSATENVPFTKSLVDQLKTEHALLAKHHAAVANHVGMGSGMINPGSNMGKGTPTLQEEFRSGSPELKQLGPDGWNKQVSDASTEGSLSHGELKHPHPNYHDDRTTAPSSVRSSPFFVYVQPGESSNETSEDSDEKFLNGSVLDEGDIGYTGDDGGVDENGDVVMSMKPIRKAKKHRNGVLNSLLHLGALEQITGKLDGSIARDGASSVGSSPSVSHHTSPVTSHTSPAMPGPGMPRAGPHGSVSGLSSYVSGRAPLSQVSSDETNSPADTIDSAAGKEGQHSLEATKQEHAKILNDSDDVLMRSVYMGSRKTTSSTGIPFPSQLTTAHANHLEKKQPSKEQLNDLAAQTLARADVDQKLGLLEVQLAQLNIQGGLDRPASPRDPRDQEATRLRDDHVVGGHDSSEMCTTDSEPEEEGKLCDRENRRLDQENRRPSNPRYPDWHPDDDMLPSEEFLRRKEAELQNLPFFNDLKESHMARNVTLPRRKPIHMPGITPRDDAAMNAGTIRKDSMTADMNPGRQVRGVGTNVGTNANGTSRMDAGRNLDLGTAANVHKMGKTLAGVFKNLLKKAEKHPKAVDEGYVTSDTDDSREVSDKEAGGSRVRGDSDDSIDDFDQNFVPADQELSK